MKSTKKKKKRILAMDAAPSAIPVKPNIAATIATMKKVNDHLSMTFFIAFFKKACQWVLLLGKLYSEMNF
jgi:hypothetical protein